MDRSLKWRTIVLIISTLVCVAILLPSFVDQKQLPSWFSWVFDKRMSFGLDLQGGKHIVYNIDLDTAIADKASEIKRDLEAELGDKKIEAIVKAPQMPLGAVTVILTDLKNKGAVDDIVHKDHGKNIESRACAKEDGDKAICYRVSTRYADDTKKAALTNAVATIRERINSKGVAEPTVVEKGDDIIVELPGDPKSPEVLETEAVIARTAKLEMKVVDDCYEPGPKGCTVDVQNHSGSKYMMNLFEFVTHHDRKGNPQEEEAKKLDIHGDPDQWRPDNGGNQHVDYFLLAYNRQEVLPEKCAREMGKVTRKTKIVDGKVEVLIDGRDAIKRYMFGDKCLNYVGLIERTTKKDPKTEKMVSEFTVPEDHEIGFEQIDPQPDDKDRRIRWRTYYLERAVRLTGSAISDAYGNYDPNTNRPIVLLSFNRYGGKVFGDVTAAIVGQKFATILDNTVKSAPIINGAIRGGSASITMGGADADAQEKDRDDLVAVLKTGSLPAPLREASQSNVGPTLGRDAISKTQTSFIVGILLVIAIMVGIYRWSGWIAVFAVVFHIVLTLAVMALFGATLTLPGIAAIVLSIGMEVDGNILIYERIRDELLLGKSVRGAIDLGFSRAFSAILDGQLTTAAAAFVLLQYGSGPIKGFAVMLLVGVFTTLTTNIWVTRILFDWNVARKKGQIQTISI